MTKSNNCVTVLYMSDEEKLQKIKEIKDNFIIKLRSLEKERDNKIKDIKKLVDQERINELLLEIKK